MRGHGNHGDQRSSSARFNLGMRGTALETDCPGEVVVLPAAIACMRAMDDDCNLSMALLNAARAAFDVFDHPPGVDAGTFIARSIERIGAHASQITQGTAFVAHGVRLRDMYAGSGPWACRHVSQDQRRAPKADPSRRQRRLGACSCGDVREDDSGKSLRRTRAVRKEQRRFGQFQLEQAR